MRFGEKLRKLRKDSHLTQAELAKRAGLGLKTITNYEKGTTYPQDRRVYSVLAEILGTDVACAGDILFEIVRIGKALKLYGRDLSAEVFGDAVADLYRVVWAVCVYSVRAEKLRINTAIHLVFVS